MTPLGAAALALFGSYLIGSLPFGLILARIVAGVDPRRAGSGNVGATNVARLAGKRWFPVVFLLDAAKGFLPPIFIAGLAPVGEGWEDILAVACAGAAILGHIYSVFLVFSGGKGVATSCGALAALAPKPLLGALGVFVLVLVFSRWVSLASMLAALALPAIAWWLEAPTEIIALSMALAIVIVIRHRSNAVRIIRGSEPRVDAPTEAEETTHV